MRMTPCRPLGFETLPGNQLWENGQGFKGKHCFETQLKHPPGARSETGTPASDRMDKPRCQLSMFTPQGLMKLHVPCIWQGLAWFCSYSLVKVKPHRRDPVPGDSTPATSEVPFSRICLNVACPTAPLNCCQPDPFLGLPSCLNSGRQLLFGIQLIVVVCSKGAL